MSYVYILNSPLMNRYYIGSTTNLERRFQEHCCGKVTSTRSYLPVQLVFKHECVTYKEARALEKRLKQFKRKDFIEKIVREGKITSI